jgi:uroporphyrinogen-III decarboxylase
MTTAQQPIEARHMTAEMTAGERMRATYEFRPVDHLYRTEFYIWEEAIARWKAEGLPQDWQERNLFNFDAPGRFDTGVNLGWCEPPFIPAYEDKVVEAHGDYEIIQDVAGRLLKVFRGRRHGFMPVYMKHAVASMADWEAVAPRLDPGEPPRWEGLAETARARRAEADQAGGILTQRLIGAYMYLRALIGPQPLLYMIHDQPEVIRAAMQGWLDLMDAALTRVQAEVELDEVFIAEDICYNHGLLISPASVREFLLPYYRQLLANARARQTRKLHFQVDTDGDCRPAIPIYREVGMTAMSPFEVAAGCDVVAIAKQHPDLVIMGGIDKRVLAAGKDAIESELQRIIPFMLDRGGYYPMCDHGVPDDVSLENYLYYRRRLCELDYR